MDTRQCLFCRMRGQGEQDDQGLRQDCPRCGKWMMDAATYEHVLRYANEHSLQQQGSAQKMGSQAIRRMQRDDEGFRLQITTDLLDLWALRREPEPEEKLNMALVWLGDHHLAGMGDSVDFDPMELSAEATLWGKNDLKMVMDEFAARGLAKEAKPNQITITMNGWKAYHALKAHPLESRTAFMAMKFDHERSYRMYADVFVPAVKQTGFDLRRVDSVSRPGLIDVQMMVDIRAAAFVVADLTGASAGAYWEAGFASGLGRPVIYTCEESSFQDSHFDTNHHVTIKWNAAHPQRAASDLKAMIRNALPDRAKMTDD
jgi:hypothetical protein